MIGREYNTNNIFSISLFKSIILLLTIAIFATNGYSKSGCCSYHGGVCGEKCCDGTALSYKCSYMIKNDNYISKLQKCKRKKPQHIPLINEIIDIIKKHDDSVNYKYLDKIIKELNRYQSRYSKNIPFDVYDVINGSSYFEKSRNVQIKKSQESKQKLLDFYNKQSYKKKKTKKKTIAIKTKHNDHINIDNLKSLNKCYCRKKVIITNFDTCQPCPFYLK